MPDVITTPAAHGAEASDQGGQTYEALRRKGASVSPFPVGAGGRNEVEKPLNFRAFEMLPPEEGGGMVRVAPFGSTNPAPQLEPGTGSVSHIITADTPPSTPAPIIVPESAHSMPERSLDHPVVVAPAPAAPRVPHVTKNVAFITPMGEFEFGCYSITESEGWLTLIGPKFPKVNPDTSIDLKIDGQTRTCYAPGINVEIELCGVKARVAHFLLTKDE